MGIAGWMTVPEAMAALGVSKQRVHALIAEGRLEARRVGRFWLVARRSVARRRRRAGG